MKLGIFGINQGALATNASLLAEVAKAAEDLGYESLGYLRFLEANAPARLVR